MDNDLPRVGRTIATGICFLSCFTRFSAICLEREYVLGWSVINLEGTKKPLDKVATSCQRFGSKIVKVTLQIGVAVEILKQSRKIQEREIKFYEITLYLSY